MAPVVRPNDESSRNLCSYKPRATVKFRVHNGRAQNSKDLLKVPGCHGHKKHKHPTHRGRHQPIS